MSESKQRGLYKHSFKSSVGVLFMARREKPGRKRIDGDTYADKLMLINLSCCIINSVKSDISINNEQDNEGDSAPVVQLRKNTACE